jgi:hypothetical protein
MSYRLHQWEHAWISRLTLSRNIYGSEPQRPDPEPPFPFSHRLQPGLQSHEASALPAITHLLVHMDQTHILPHYSLSCPFIIRWTLLATNVVKAYRLGSTRCECSPYLYFCWFHRPYDVIPSDIQAAFANICSVTEAENRLLRWLWRIQ